MLRLTLELIPLGDESQSEIIGSVEMSKLDPTIASLIGKKGANKFPPKGKLRPNYSLDPRYQEILNMQPRPNSEEFWQAMKESGLIDDYPLLRKYHSPTSEDFT